MDRDGITLSARERGILLATLSRFAEHIDRVAIFGSRALGRAQPGSDIDLAIYGDIDDAAVARVWTLLDESSLAVTVDLVRYAGLDETSFRRHIDQYGKSLFEREELIAARDTASRAA